MKPLSNRCAPRERGFAMIAILSLAALLSAFLIASALNPTAAGVSSEREERSMNALREAKAALIAYAANEEWQRFKDATTANQPGGLPCPDGDDDGDSDGICPNAPLRIGRLPYKTIGSPDLTDASGERLWYAVSSNFYKSTANVINSDTPGLLMVTGAAPASNVVAVVVAAGDVLSGQDRILQHNNHLAYLEGVTVGGTDSTFNTVALPTAAANDRLIAITQAELMAAVEPVVAARIERDIKSYINQDYKPDDFSTPSSWWTGGYPFAAPFVSGGVGPGRSQDQYTGDLTMPTLQGLMPVSRNAGVAWDPGSVTVIDHDPMDDRDFPWTDPEITSVNCGASTAAELVCVVNYTGNLGERPGIRLRATLLNAGKAFLSPASKSNTSITEFGGMLADWSSTLSPNPQVTNALLSNGNATVTFYGRLQSVGGTSKPVTIRVTVPAYHALSNGADTKAGWFIANQWYRQTYYAVSQGWVPGGGTGCTAGGTCLTVNNLPPSYAQSNDKRLILVFAGRALDGSMRPTNDLANYFELENSIPNVTFQHHPFGLPTTINDRVVVVAP